MLAWQMNGNISQIFKIDMWLRKQHGETVNKAVILPSLGTIFLTFCRYDVTIWRKGKTERRCRNNRRRCYGKFREGVKPSLVTNPSVVFRGIFNYRLNKISARENDGNEDWGSRIWRKTAPYGTSNWIVHVSTAPLYDRILAEKKDSS